MFHSPDNLKLRVASMCAKSTTLWEFIYHCHYRPYWKDTGRHCFQSYLSFCSQGSCDPMMHQVTLSNDALYQGAPLPMHAHLFQVEAPCTPNHDLFVQGPGPTPTPNIIHSCVGKFGWYTTYWKVFLLSSLTKKENWKRTEDFLKQKMLLQSLCFSYLFFASKYFVNFPTPLRNFNKNFLVGSIFV